MCSLRPPPSLKQFPSSRGKRRRHPPHHLRLCTGPATSRHRLLVVSYWSKQENDTLVSEGANSFFVSHCWLSAKRTRHAAASTAGGMVLCTSPFLGADRGCGSTLVPMFISEVSCRSCLDGEMCADPFLRLCSWFLALRRQIVPGTVGRLQHFSHEKSRRVPWCRFAFCIPPGSAAALVSNVGELRGASWPPATMTQHGGAYRSHSKPPSPAEGSTFTDIPRSTATALNNPTWP